MFLALVLQANTLQRLVPSDAVELPLNVVYDCGTIKRYALMFIMSSFNTQKESSDYLSIFSIPEKAR